jgi:hypothetical protein
MPDIQAQTPDGVIHSFPDGTPDEVIDKAIKAYSTDATITGIKAPAQPDTSKPEQGIAAAEHPSNPFSRYMTEAENLTEEGKKEHPIENVIGTASRGLKQFGNIVGTMAPLLMGPGGGVAGAGMGRNPAPPQQAQLPAGETIITPPPEIKQLPAGPNRIIEAPAAPDESFVRGVPAEIGGPGKAAGPTIETPKEAYPAPGPKPTTGRMISDLVNQAYGIEPLKPDVPIKEQIPQEQAAPAAGPAPDSLQARYPDRAVRSMVHANGENIVNAVGNDPETMRAIHDLTRVELRQALVNSGEDMGQQTISSSKFAGEGSITRQQAFDRLLQKGLSPKKIVEFAKKIPAAGP